MSFLKRPIEIRTNRCLLTEMKVADAPFWFEFMADERVRQYLPDRIETVAAMKSTLEWLVSNYHRDISEIERLTLATYLKDDKGGPVGWVTYGPLPEDGRLQEIGYAIGPARRGKGLATESAEGFIGYLRENVTRRKLYATVDKDNSASINVLKKLGLKKAGNSAAGMPNALKNHELYHLVRRERRRGGSGRLPDPRPAPRPTRPPGVRMKAKG